MQPTKLVRDLKLLTLTLCLGILIACDSGTQKSRTMETTNEEAADQIIDDRQGWYEKWDGNNNGMLENEEFSKLATSNFEAWDINNNDLLDKEEIVANWSYTFPMDYRGNWMSEWDSDGDGNLAPSEFNQGVFEFMDVNDSGVLENDELYIEQ